MIDSTLQQLVKDEKKRQTEGIELIPSENFASASVRSYLSTEFVNKYSEGYPGKRYYGGNEVVDKVEILAQERAKKLFGVPYVNVQPYSGSPANLAVYLAVCKPGDSIMGQGLTDGGHLTHGHRVSATGLFYISHQYGVDPTKKDLFDYDAILKLALEHKPKLIWVGATAHPLIFNYKKFSEIAEKVGAVLAADIAHIAGLIIGGVHPSPVPYVHIVTTTTHKTLRGPRGAMIMVTKKGMEAYPDLPDRINKAVFPGLQGGPHDNQTAAIAAALAEASTKQFAAYAKQIVKNSLALANELKKQGMTLVGGTTQNHLILVDLTSVMGPGAGIFMQHALDASGLTLNKNTVPGEKSSPFYPSGIRLGTPAATSRGMKEKDMKKIGAFIGSVLNIVKGYALPGVKEERLKLLKEYTAFIAQNREIKKIRNEVRTMAKQFILP
ncbi:MAG: serine hydroxymethyltransferase [bacterium]